jgi:hypothetical protein
MMIQGCWKYFNAGMRGGGGHALCRKIRLLMTIYMQNISDKAIYGACSTHGLTQQGNDKTMGVPWQRLSEHANYAFLFH